MSTHVVDSMAEPVAKMPGIAPPRPPSKAVRTNVDATGEATNSLTPEIVIALCGPIGSPLHEAAAQIENALNEFGYVTEKLRLSEVIRLNASEVDKSIDRTSKFTEINSLISAGDALRERYGSDVLAKLAIAKIGGDRTKQYGEFSDRANESEIGRASCRERV